MQLLNGITRVLLVTLVALALQFQIALANNAWSYATSSQWMVEFPAYCAGSSQSPIDLKSETAQAGTQPTPLLSATGTQTAGTAWTVTADGHSFKTVVKGSGQTFRMDLDPADPVDFILDSYHFHWGKDSTSGSEHTLSGAKYPLELHLVHYNSKYDSVASAIKDPKGLAVLGIFFREASAVSSDNLISKLLPADMSPLQVAGGTTTVPAFSITDQLLKEATLKKFYRYSGSLTTPTCDEVVTWTVLSEPLLVSTAQLNSIRKVALANGDLYNNRPVQALNGRIVYKNFAPRKEMSATVITGFSCLISIIVYLSSN